MSLLDEPEALDPRRVRRTLRLVRHLKRSGSTRDLVTTLLVLAITGLRTQGLTRENVLEEAGHMFDELERVERIQR